MKDQIKNNNRGSMTLEAAVILPLYVFFFISLFSVFYMLHFGQNMTYSLTRAAKQTAVYVCAEDMIEKSSEQIYSAADEEGGEQKSEAIDGINIAQTVLAEGYAMQKLSEYLPDDYRQSSGLKGNISLVRSNVSGVNEIIDLRASYTLQPTFNFFNLPGVKFASRARTKAWTGWDDGCGKREDKEDERMVYVAENGEVYHLSKSCTHLDLTIYPVEGTRLESERNASGAKYKPCEKCGADLNMRLVYITREGDRYHSSLSCSGLKRTVYEVPLSSVKGKRLCSRCAGTK
jgi:hypothetical protein